MYLTIETQRLILRPVEQGDVDDVYEYSKEPNVGPNAGWAPHKSREETLQIMNEIFINQPNIWGIVIKDTQKCIGTIGLVNDPKRDNEKSKMVGYAIGSKFWGVGYTTEAAKAVLKYGFQTLGLDIIAAYCYPNNSRSRRVIEKIGMSYEGSLRKAEKCFDKEVRDNLCFSLDKEEYYKGN